LSESEEKKRVEKLWEKRWFVFKRDGPTAQELDVDFMT